jgi:tungstate transport system permease protein
VSEIVSGFFQAINLIITLNPEVMQIASLSLFISLAATILAAVISIPLGGLIHFHEFRGKRMLIVLIQTLYSYSTSSSPGTPRSEFSGSFSHRKV